MEMITLNSASWHFVDTHPEIYNGAGDITFVEWNRIEKLLSARRSIIINMVYEALRWNGIITSQVTPAQIADAIYSHHKILEHVHTFDLQCATPTQLGFTGTKRVKLKTFLQKAFEIGLIPCPKFIPILMSLGSNMFFDDDGQHVPEYFRFVTRPIKGYYFQMTKSNSGFTLSTSVVNMRQDVHVEYPHIFVKPTEKMRENFVNNPYWRRVFPDHSFKSIPDNGKLLSSII